MLQRASTVVVATLALVAGLMPGVPGVGDAASATTDDASQASREASGDARIADEVSERLRAKGRTDYWVVFDQQANLDEASAVEDWTKRGKAVVSRLKETARESQQRTRRILRDSGVRYESFWISNRILVEAGDSGLADRLSELPEVSELTQPRKVSYAPPSESEPTARARGVEWGIPAINADEVWDRFGIRGSGITVGSIDTGAQFDHPALVDKYRGNLGDGEFEHDYNWFDPSGVCDTAEPCDWNGHGSHTIGTMIGSNGPDERIGVAPDANWISAMGCDIPPGQCSPEALLASGQWMLAPTDANGENPRADRRPQIVNNSWGAGVDNPWYDDILSAWNAAGMFAVFSNGNDGPGCDTAGSPGDRPEAYAVGAFDESGDIAEFSSRGPGSDEEIRPNISAPGVRVRSAVPDDGYATYSGTSMAAPHLAGAVALIWSAAPALVGDVEETRDLLDGTAIDRDDTSCGGTPEDNNVWGEGRLDVLAALRQVPRGDSGTLAGTVTDAETGDPIPGVQIRVTGAAVRQTTTDADGSYDLTLPVGTYHLTAEAFGFAAGEADAEVTVDENVSLDVALQPQPMHAVSGQVTDAWGDPVPEAPVELDGTPLQTTTDADGTYAFEAVPEDDYRMTVSGFGCVRTARTDITVDRARTVDVEMANRSDEHGYRCRTQDPSYVEGDTKLDLNGVAEQVHTLDLPFPTWLYGRRYDQMHVSNNGMLTLTDPSIVAGNGPLPSEDQPNAAIYPFWTDMHVDEQAAVYTGVTGTAPNRSVIVEWRNVKLFGASGRVDVEAKLREDGDIVFAYRNLDPDNPAEVGIGATVGIENSDGTDALEYAAYETILSDERAIRFTVPDAGFVTGTVTDAEDGDPVDQATVTVTDGDEVLAETATGADGEYAMQVGVGEYRITADARRYRENTRRVAVSEDDTASRDLTLATARAEARLSDGSPVVVPGEGQRTRTLTLSNTGSTPLRWDVAEVGGDRVGNRPTPDDELREQAAADHPTARTAEALYSPRTTKQAERSARTELGEQRRSATSDAVLRSWSTDGLPWGVGFDGNVWVSEPFTGHNTEFTVDGTPTGTRWSPDWGGNWQADMALDSRRGLLCQVNAGGGKAVHCWDPDTGEVDYTLDHPRWTSRSQRGVAYNEHDDSFYVGGWLEDVIYHVAGPSAPNPGEVLGRCRLDAGIAGLAYHSLADQLWVSTNAPTSSLLRVDPGTCEVADRMAFPGADTANAGAGLAMDGQGHLWVSSLKTGKIYQMDGDLPLRSEVEWLSTTPADGELAPGESTELTVRLDTTGLDPGHYRASVLLETNAGRQPVVEVPVDLVVAGYREAVDAGSESGSRDSAGAEWSADRRYETGGSGWVGKSHPRSAPKKTTIGGTPDDQLYVDRRVGMDAYRFDDLPAGTYRVTLDYAELTGRIPAGRRTFDVAIDGTTVQSGYDIAAEVGHRRADRRSFVVRVEQHGDLVVDFEQRAPGLKPAVNALRVVHRPDLG